MSKPIKKRKEMKIPSFEALKMVKSVVIDADEVLKDSSRKIKDSPIGEAISGAIGIGLGSGVSFASLYFGGSIVGLSAAGITSGLASAGALIGGGMVAGMAVLAAPAVILGSSAVGVTYYMKSKKLKDEKALILEQAIDRLKLIVKVLNEESALDKDRKEYLYGIKILLNAAIENLKHDLGK